MLISKATRAKAHACVCTLTLIRASAQIYAILIAFQRQHMLRERASILRSTYIARLVTSYKVDFGANYKDSLWMVKLHKFLFSTLDGDNLSASCLNLLIHRQNC